MGYQVTTVTPANIAAQSRGGVALDDDFAVGARACVSRTEGILLGQAMRPRSRSPPAPRPVQIGGLLLLGELAAHRRFDRRQIHIQQLRHNADIDHVLDQLAQLGLGADGGGDLVEGNRIADHIVAILLQVRRFFVDGNTAGGQRENVILRRFGVHRHQDVDLFLARDIAVLAGANGVPGRQSRDVRGEEILAADGNAHREDAASAGRCSPIAIRSR